MASARTVRTTCTQRDIASALETWTPGRPLPMLFLLLGDVPSDEEGARLRLVQAVLLKARENGFLVGLPVTDEVVKFVEGLTTEDGEDMALCLKATAEFETNRGRRLGPMEVLLVDLPWAGTVYLSRARSMRGAGRDYELTAFVLDGVNARPVPVSILDRVRAWISAEMVLDTAAEYQTGEEEVPEEEPAEDLQKAAAASEGPSRLEYASLLARLEAMEARARAPAQAAPVQPRNGGQLFGATAAGLDDAAWERLKALAGAPPRKVRAPEPQVPEPGAGTFREAELEVLPEPAAEDPFQDLSELTPLHRILAAQLAQNRLLIERLLPSRQLDAVSAALGSGGASGSGEPSGIKGCLARDAFLRQIQEPERVAETARQSALRELGIAPNHEEPNLMKLYLERRVPLAGHRLLGYVGFLAATGWEQGQASQNKELQAFAARMLFFVEQAAIDAGKLQLAFLMSGFPEPPPQLWSVQRKSSLKPFSSLMHPAWAAANISYLKDLDFLESKMSTLGKAKDETTPEAVWTEGGQKGWRAKRKAKPKGQGDGA